MPTADELISPAVIAALAGVLEDSAQPRRAWPSVRRAASELGPLGLSDRARLVRDALLADVGGNHPAVAAAIRAALPSPALAGWMIWPVTEAVATSAVASGRARDFDDGLRLLAALTSRLTGEFAIRTFLNADLDRTVAAALRWTRHADPGVRRLATEGTRPRLPWARRVPLLTARPEVTIPILDRLYTDPEEVVRRSVANHLNDLSRLDPALAIEAARRWTAAPDQHTAPLVRRAMRTLVKAADPDALALMGFTGGPDALHVVGPTLREQVVLDGGELVFDAVITNQGTEAVQLSIDYVIHYRKASGSTAPKVFKLTTRGLQPGEQVSLMRRQSFRPLSTRRHYPGRHAVELQVNGTRYGRAEFQLDDPT